MRTVVKLLVSYILNDMITDFFSWWYGAGLRSAVAGIGRRAQRPLDDFSVGLLLRTLFAPFRQIDAGGVRGSLDVQIKAWFGREFSRFFGAGLRTIMIIIGLIGSALSALLSTAWLIIWLLLPVVPILSVILWLGGVAR